MVRFNQMRGTAWACGSCTRPPGSRPTATRSAPYFQRCAANNWAWLRSQIPAWTAAQGEAMAGSRATYGPPGELPPWQQDYFASTAAAAARQGNADARAVLDWMENFLVGRFLSGGRGFNPHDGSAYLLAIRRNARRTPLRPGRRSARRRRRAAGRTGTAGRRARRLRATRAAVALPPPGGDGHGAGAGGLFLVRAGRCALHRTGPARGVAVRHRPARGRRGLPAVAGPGLPLTCAGRPGGRPPVPLCRPPAQSGIASAPAASRRGRFIG